jgi:hypothetical protein
MHLSLLQEREKMKMCRRSGCIMVVAVIAGLRMLFSGRCIHICRCKRGTRKRGGRAGESGERRPSGSSRREDGGAVPKKKSKKIAESSDQVRNAAKLSSLPLSLLFSASSSGHHKNGHSS